MFHFYLSQLFLNYSYRFHTLILLMVKLVICGLIQSGQHDLNKYCEKYFPQFHTMQPSEFTGAFGKCCRSAIKFFSYDGKILLP